MRMTVTQSRPHPLHPGADPTLEKATLDLLGFNFSYRDSHVDWRLIHGIDVDSVVRLTDVQAIEDCLNCLQHGNLEERGLSIKNCKQLFRLQQLAIEYVGHLFTAHTSLLHSYDEAVAAAERWHHAANTYVHLGEVFVDECTHNAAMSMQRLGEVDVARAELEEQDRLYNLALDQLEVDDRQARYFHFRKQRSELNWQQVHAVDLEELTENIDTALLDKVLHNITYGSILGEDTEELTPHHFHQLIPLAQCALDYVLFKANATGTLLEQAMGRLQSICSDIPPLTSAAEAMHSRVSAFVAEAHAVRQQRQQAAAEAAARLPMPGAAHLGVGLSRPQSSHLGLPPWRTTSPVGRVDILTNSPRGFFSAPVPAPGVDMAGTNGGGMGGDGRGDVGTGITGTITDTRKLYEDLLAGEGGGELLPAVEMQGRTAELHGKVDDLEKDLRLERYKTDEMRRILTQIRERIYNPPTGALTRPVSPQLSVTGFDMRPSSPELLGLAGSGPMGGVDSWTALGSAFTPFATTSGALAAAMAQQAVSQAGTQTLALQQSFMFDENGIRSEERRRALQLLSSQVDSVKQDAQRQAAARRRTGASGVAPGPPAAARRPRAGDPTGPAAASRLARITSETLLGAERPGGSDGGSGPERGAPPAGRGRMARVGSQRPGATKRQTGHHSSQSAGNLSEMGLDGQDLTLPDTKGFGATAALQPPSNEAEAAAFLRAVTAAASAGRGKPPAGPSRAPSKPQPAATGPLTRGLASLSRISAPGPDAEAAAGSGAPQAFTSNPRASSPGT